MAENPSVRPRPFNRTREYSSPIFVETLLQGAAGVSLNQIRAEGLQALLGAADEGGAAMGEFYFGDVVRQGEWLAQVHVVPFLDVILKEDLDQPIRNRGAPDGDVFNPDLSLAIRGVELSIGGHSLLAFEEGGDDGRGPIVSGLGALVELVEVHFGGARDVVGGDVEREILDGRGQELARMVAKIGVGLVVGQNHRIVTSSRPRGGVRKHLDLLFQSGGCGGVSGIAMRGQPAWAGEFNIGKRRNWGEGDKHEQTI